MTHGISHLQAGKACTNWIGHTLNSKRNRALLHSRVVITSSRLEEKKKLRRKNVEENIFSQTAWSYSFKNRTLCGFQKMPELYINRQVWNLFGGMLRAARMKASNEFSQSQVMCTFLSLNVGCNISCGEKYRSLPIAPKQDLKELNSVNGKGHQSHGNELCAVSSWYLNFPLQVLNS